MTMKRANVRDKNKTLAIPGIYPFTIGTVTSSWETGNSQVGPHSKYSAAIEIDCGDQGKRDVDDVFEDVDSYAWKFGKLFVAVGAVKPDNAGFVDYDPEWMRQMQGRTGFVRLTNNEFKTKSGETAWSNRISYLDPAKVNPANVGPNPGASLPAEYVATQIARQAQQFAADSQERPAAPQTIQGTLPTMANPSPVQAPLSANAASVIAQAAAGTDEIPF